MLRYQYYHSLVHEHVLVLRYTNCTCTTSSRLHCSSSTLIRTLCVSSVVVVVLLYVFIGVLCVLYSPVCCLSNALIEG